MSRVSTNRTGAGEPAPRVCQSGGDWPRIGESTFWGSELAWARKPVADCTRIWAVENSAISAPKSVSQMALSEAAMLSRAVARDRPCDSDSLAWNAPS